MNHNPRNEREGETSDMRTRERNKLSQKEKIQNKKIEREKPG